jgi:hypothetical protein
MTETSGDETIPVWLHDAMMAIWEKKADEMLKAQAETLERVRYSNTHHFAAMIAIYQSFLEILDHPRGGPEALRKAILGAIEDVKQIDVEDA